MYSMECIQWDVSNGMYQMRCINGMYPMGCIKWDVSMRCFQCFVPNDQSFISNDLSRMFRIPKFCTKELRFCKVPNNKVFLFIDQMIDCLIY